MRWSNSIKTLSFILTGLMLLTACEQYVVEEDEPINEVGRLYIHEKYYVDRVGINMYENRVNPYIEGGEPGAKIYWSLIDPDDPAIDGIIDQNSSGGDDNEGKTSDFYGSDINYEGEEAYSVIDDRGHTECFFDIKPDEVFGSVEYYITGDNFKVKATKDSPDGEIYTESEIFSVWKKSEI